MRRLAELCSLVALTLASACGNQPTPSVADDSGVPASETAPSTPLGTITGGVTRPIVLHDNVAVLDESLVGPVVVDASSITVRASGNDSLSLLAPGSVVAGASGGGFLRKVVRVETIAATGATSLHAKGIGSALLHIVTNPASLLDAIKDGEFRFTFTSAPVKGGIGALTKSWAAGISVDYTWSVTPSASIHVSIAGGHIDMLQAEVTATASAQLSEAFTIGLAQSWNGSVPLLDSPLAQGFIFLGALPVWTQLRLHMDATASASVTARAKTSLAGGCAAVAGGRATYSSTGWTFEDLSSRKCDPPAFTFDLDGSAEASVGIAPRIELSFDGLLVPSISSTLTANAQITACPPPSGWKASFDTSAQANVAVGFLGLTADFSHDLGKASIPIASGDLPTPSICQDAGADAATTETSDAMSDADSSATDAALDVASDATTSSRGDAGLPDTSAPSTCSSGSMCGTGNCVNGVCCSVPVCSPGQVCNYVGHVGSCTRPLGAMCATGADCGSNNCVDGVCCYQSACSAGQSCANPGSAGICS